MKQFLTFLASISTGLSLHAQWVPANSTATTAKFDAIHFFDSQNGICSGGFISQQSTTDGGATWTSGTQAGARDYSFANATDGFLASVSGQAIKKTSNGAQTWAILTPPTSNSLWAVATISASTAIFGGTGGALWKTTNGGTSFSVLTSGTTSLITDVVFTDATTGYMAVQSGIIRKTTNGGTSWSTVYTAPSSFTEMCFPSSTVGYAASNGGKIHKTIDAGATWSVQNTGIPTAVYQGIHFYDVNHGVAVGYSGIIVTTDDGGATWCQQVSGTTQHLYDVRMLSATNALVIGDSGTIIRNTAISNSACSLSTIETQLDSEIKIFPNPVINELTVSTKGIKEVSVFNITGQCLNVPEEYTTGTIKLDFSDLPSGIYQLEIVSESGTAQQKVTK